MSADSYEAWKMSRLGRATASRVKDVIAETKKGPSTSRRKYLIELLAERLTGMPAKQFVSEAMLWGNSTEPQARAAYEQSTGKTVEQVWFIDHPTIPMSGASPDGLVGDDGLLEIKCGETATHLTFLLEKKINPDHVTQMQWQMATTGRKWCDYASFDPRLPVALQLSVVRVPRDDAAIEAMEKAVIEFLAELDAAVKSLGPFEIPARTTHGTVKAYVDTSQPMDMQRQIRPEDEANWQPSQLVRPRA
ncbi:MAG TPA: YqaJ viral recombinase family protein [Terracidiphilus sp.]|nr:YqaJ viral recombinase family protein [Terracidiphilus sp.]